MNKKMLLLVVVFAVFALAGSSALALAPMGPPTAGLKTGQIRAGVEYAYSNADFKVDLGDDVDLGDIDLGDDDEVTVKDVKLNMWTANIGYGVMDEWEVFARLGAANAKKSGIFEDEDLSIDFSGDYGFAWGLGTKFTFLKQENIDWGVLFQIGWLKTKGTDSVGPIDESDEGTGYYSIWDYDSKLSVYDIEIAVGPTWKATEGLSIYGGPFFNLVNGDFDVETFGTLYDDEDEVDDTAGPYSGSADVKQKSIFGGYVGAQYDLSQNASVFGEFQFTGGTLTFATGVGWKF